MSLVKTGGLEKECLRQSIGLNLSGRFVRRIDSDAGSTVENTYPVSLSDCAICFRYAFS